MAPGNDRNRGGRRYHNQKSFSTVAKETASSLSPDSPVLAIFKDAAQKLTERQDRHEKLVKLSRDITIESKRIIFLLHSAVKKEDQEKILKEADERLNKLVNGPIMAIGLELENKPAFLHARAVSPGFQEFIEALTLFYLLKHGELITYDKVEKMLSFVKSSEAGESQMVTLLPQNDYMLGIADLTGELMRRAINCISSGDSEDCFQACQVVRDLYTGYLGLFSTGKELSYKLNTTRANVSKVENAVYALKVRGGEAPPTLLIPSRKEWEEQQHHSDDEGFY